jgi:hypothetical protein
MKRVMHAMHAQSQTRRAMQAMSKQPNMRTNAAKLQPKKQRAQILMHCWKA